METVGVTEAKERWSELLDRVAQGEKITITRHGVPAGMLLRVAEDKTAARVMREVRPLGEVVDK